MVERITRRETRDGRAERQARRGPRQRISDAEARAGSARAILGRSRVTSWPGAFPAHRRPARRSGAARRRRTADVCDSGEHYRRGVDRRPGGRSAATDGRSWRAGSSPRWTDSAAPVPAGDQRARQRCRGRRRLPGAARPAVSRRPASLRVASSRTYLNKNTIREIAHFQAQLNRQAELIRERIETINGSLVDIDYNGGPLHPPGAGADAEHRDQGFQSRSAGLHRRRGRRPARATTITPSRNSCRSSGSSSASRGGRGRPTWTRSWTQLVTDVRQVVRLLAPPSGGATTIASTSTTPTRPESRAVRRRSWPTRSWPRRSPTSSSWSGAARKSRTFRFVVIDEAFGRGSDESTRYASRAVHASSSLQLLIVTPLQKIHVIEPLRVGGRLRRQPTATVFQAAQPDDRGVSQQRLAHALGAQPRSRRRWPDVTKPGHHRRRARDVRKK